MTDFSVVLILHSVFFQVDPNAGTNNGQDVENCQAHDGPLLESASLEILASGVVTSQEEGEIGEV